MKQFTVLGFASALVITALVAGCGGGGSGGTTITPVTRQATVHAVERVNLGGGIRGVFTGVLMSHLGLVSAVPGRAAASRAAASRAPSPQEITETYTDEEGNQWSITTRQDQSASIHVYLAAGGTLAAEVDAPQQSGSVTTVTASLTINTPSPDAASLTIAGTLSLDDRGTPNLGDDDAVAMGGTLSGNVAVPEIGAVNLAGNLSLQASMTAGLSYNAALTATAGDGTQVQTSEELNVNLQGVGAMTATTSVTAPNGARTTFSVQVSSAGNATLTVTDASSGAGQVRMDLTLTANQTTGAVTGSGAVRLNGQQIATVAVDASGQGVITYTDGSKETLDMFGLIDAASMPDFGSLFTGN